MSGVLQQDGSDITTLYGGKVLLRFDPKDHEYSVSIDGAPYSVVPSVTRINGATSDKPELVKWAAKKSSDWFVEKTTELAREYQNKRAALLKANDKASINALNEETVCNLLDEVRIAEWSNNIRWAHRNSVNTAASVGTVAHKFAEDVIAWKLGEGEKPNPPMNPSAKNAGMAFVKWFQDNKVEFISSESRLYSLKHNYAGTMDIEAIVNGEFCIVDLKTSKDVYEEHLLQICSYSAARLEESGKRYDAGWIIRIDKESANFKAVRIDGKYITEVGARYGSTKEHYDTLMLLKDVLSTSKKAGK